MLGFGRGAARRRVPLVRAFQLCDQLPLPVAIRLHGRCQSHWRLVRVDARQRALQQGALGARSLSFDAICNRNVARTRAAVSIHNLKRYFNKPRQPQRMTGGR